MGKKDSDDRFKRFGTVGFTATSKVNDFMDHLDQGKVMGTRCTQCGLDFFPPRADCCQCMGTNLEWFDASAASGQLVTFSKMQYGPVGFEKDLPYTIAVVDFGSFRVFGRISGDIPDEAITIGMPMTVKANRLADDRMNFVFHRA
jgi:uncharacterized OB-fold protein